MSNQPPPDSWNHPQGQNPIPPSGQPQQPAPMQQPAAPMQQPLPAQLAQPAPVGSPLVQPMNPYAAPAPDAIGGKDSYISGTAIEVLLATRPWVYLLSFVGFLIGVLCLLVGVLAVIVISAGRVPSSDLAGIQAFSLVGYLVSAAIYLWGASMLRRFGYKITNFATYPSADSLNEALSAQRSFWRFSGIIVLIFIGLLVLLLVPSLLFTATGF